jgi:hypothetical protein
LPGFPLEAYRILLLVLLAWLLGMITLLSALTTLLATLVLLAALVLVGTSHIGTPLVTIERRLTAMTKSIKNKFDHGTRRVPFLKATQRANWNE